MASYYNDARMAYEHRQDLLDEVRLDHLVREARAGRRNKAGELASKVIMRFSCMLINWGQGIRAASQVSQRSAGPVGSVLMGWGLRLNGRAAGGPGPCECCN